MLDIGNYIKEILKIEDSVIVPELGAFTTSYKSAQISSKSKSISPPTKEITFIEKLKKDNGRLVRFISEKENITETETRHEINEFVKNAITELENGKHVRFTGLGYLYKDKAYKIQFVQDQSENILLDSFGLEEIEWESENNSKINLPEKQHTRKTKGKVLVIPIAILAVIILVLSMLIADKIKLNNENNSLISSIFGENRKIEKLNQENNISANVEKDIDSLSVKRNALYYEQDKYAIYNSFYIIAGSFSIYNNAEKMKVQLKKQGYNAEILEVDGKIFRVAMKKFDNRNEALQELMRLQQVHKENKLWILNSM